jgi:hypothetical protein
LISTPFEGIDQTVDQPSPAVSFLDVRGRARLEAAAISDPADLGVDQATVASSDSGERSRDAALFTDCDARLVVSLLAVVALASRLPMVNMCPV